jgi:hypothetical protein
MVMWEDCQIDKAKEQGEKPEKWFAAVAPVKSAKDFPPESQARIGRYEYHRFYPLPANPDAGLPNPLNYVDLRYVWPVKQSLLTKRLASLSDTARGALRRHLFLFFSQRQIIDPVTCPKCGTEVPTTKSAAEGAEKKAPED